MNQIKVISHSAQQQNRTLGKMSSAKSQISQSSLKFSVPEVSTQLTFKFASEKVG